MINKWVGTILKEEVDFDKIDQPLFYKISRLTPDLEIFEYEELFEEFSISFDDILIELEEVEEDEKKQYIYNLFIGILPKKMGINSIDKPFARLNMWNKIMTIFNKDHNEEDFINVLFKDFENKSNEEWKNEKLRRINDLKNVIEDEVSDEVEDEAYNEESEVFDDVEDETYNEESEVFDDVEDETYNEEVFENNEYEKLNEDNDGILEFDDNNEFGDQFNGEFESSNKDEFNEGFNGEFEMSKDEGDEQFNDNFVISKKEKVDEQFNESFEISENSENNEVVHRGSKKINNSKKQKINNSVKNKQLKVVKIEKIEKVIENPETRKKLEISLKTIEKNKEEQKIEKSYFDNLIKSMQEKHSADMEKNASILNEKINEKNSEILELKNLEKNKQKNENEKLRENEHKYIDSLTKPRLVEIAEHYEISDCKKLKKAELVKKIMEQYELNRVKYSEKDLKELINQKTKDLKEKTGTQQNNFDSFMNDDNLFDNPGNDPFGNMEQDTDKLFGGNEGFSGLDVPNGENPFEMNNNEFGNFNVPNSEDDIFKNQKSGFENIDTNSNQDDMFGAQKDPFADIDNNDSSFDPFR